MHVCVCVHMYAYSSKCISLVYSTGTKHVHIQICMHMCGCLTYGCTLLQMFAPLAFESMLYLRWNAWCMCACIHIYIYIYIYLYIQHIYIYIYIYIYHSLTHTHTHFCSSQLMNSRFAPLALESMLYLRCWNAWCPCAYICIYIHTLTHTHLFLTAHEQPLRSFSL